MRNYVANPSKHISLETMCFIALIIEYALYSEQVAFVNKLSHIRLDEYEGSLLYRGFFLECAGRNPAFAKAVAICYDGDTPYARITDYGWKIAESYVQHYFGSALFSLSFDALSEVYSADEKLVRTAWNRLEEFALSEA